MGCLFLKEKAPTNYRDWKTSNYTFYDTLAGHLIARGIMCEPDSREPWFISAKHDQACLDETLAVFEEAVDITVKEVHGRYIRRLKTESSAPEAAANDATPTETIPTA